MTQHIYETVSVLAIFKPTSPKLFPYKIRWNGRDYYAQEITSYYKTSDNQKLYHIFSLRTTTLNMQLSFEPETMLWKLREVTYEE